MQPILLANRIQLHMNEEKPRQPTGTSVGVALGNAAIVTFLLACLTSCVARIIVPEIGPYPPSDNPWVFSNLIGVLLWIVSIGVGYLVYRKSRFPKP